MTGNLPDAPVYKVVIRGGQLVASRLGRAYRIPRHSLDLLLWSTRTRRDISLRDYTGEQIAGFIEADRLDEQAQEIAWRFSEATKRRSGKGRRPGDASDAAR